MTTVDLYKKHKAGGVSREKFLYEVRRDSMLPFITNLTSYSDAVQILKNKGIIREESFPEESAYNQGKAANKSRKNYTDNPYSKDYEPDKYEEWTDGWMDAESEGQMAHDNAKFRGERGGIDEAEGSEMYYAIFNKLGELGDGYPLYFTSNSKEDLVNTLNRTYKEMTGEKYIPYSLEDIEPHIYMGKRMSHFISDDWSSVTDNEEAFKNDLSYLPNAVKYRANTSVSESEGEYNPDAAWQEGYDAFEAGSHQEENPYEGDTSEHKNWDMGYEKAQHDGPGLNEDPVSDRVEKAIRDKKLDPKLVKKAAEDAERGNSTALATLIATAGMMKEKEEYVSDTSYLEGHDAAFEGYIDELITKAGKNGMPKEFSQIGKAILDDYPNVGRHDYDMFVDYNDDGSIKAIDGSFSPNADDYFGRSSVVFSYDFINNKIIYTEKSGLNEAIKRELTLDTVNPYEFRKGMQWELGYATLPAPNWDQNTVTDEDFAKAGKKVLKNLSSDPNYYTILISNKGEKPKKVKEVKVEEDGMAKIKGVEKVTANVQTSLGKKERGKKHPEGVKEMRGTKRTFSKIKLMKEGDLNAALDKNLRKLFK